MKKILYIHGFASNGNSEKARILQQYFKAQNVIAPTLSVEPRKAIEQLKSIVIEMNNDIFPIGTSMGGFYSWYVCQYFGIPGIQINPLVDIDTMLHVVGVNKNYQTNETFQFYEAYIEQMKEMKNSIHEVNSHLLHLFVGMQDEVLNPALAEVAYQEAQIYRFNDNHRFEKFESCLGLINEIINKAD